MRSTTESVGSLRIKNFEGKASEYLSDMWVHIYFMVAGGGGSGGKMTNPTR